MSDTDETTTETIETPAEPTPIPTEADLDAALKGSMDEPWDVFGDEADPVPADETKADDAPKDDEKTTTEEAKADGDETTNGEETEETDETDEGPEPKKKWTWSRARKERQQAEQAIATAHDLQAQVAQQQRELQGRLAEQQKLQELARTDPTGAVKQWARDRGLNPDEVLTAWQADRLQLGTEEEQQPKLTPREQAMQDRLDKLEADQQQRDQRSAADQETSIRHQQVGIVLQETASKSKDYPYLATVSQDDRIRVVSNAISLMRDKGIQRTKEQVCRVLDQEIKKSYDHQHTGLTELLQAAPPADAPGIKGGGSQDEPKPAGEPLRRSGRKRGAAPSNSASGATSTGARQKTHEELMLDLDRDLVASMAHDDTLDY